MAEFRIYFLYFYRPQYAFWNGKGQHHDMEWPSAVGQLGSPRNTKKEAPGIRAQPFKVSFSGFFLSFFAALALGTKKLRDGSPLGSPGDFKSRTVIPMSGWVEHILTPNHYMTIWYYMNMYTILYNTILYDTIDWVVYYTIWYYMINMEWK